MAGNFDRKLRLQRIHFRVLLHAANMRHGTNGFTYLPKEGGLRIFFGLKNPTASAGFEPANMGTKSQHAILPKPHVAYIVSFIIMETGEHLWHQDETGKTYDRTGLNGNWFSARFDVSRLCTRRWTFCCQKERRISSLPGTLLVAPRGRRSHVSSIELSQEWIKGIYIRYSFSEKWKVF